MRRSGSYTKRYKVQFIDIFFVFLKELCVLLLFPGLSGISLSRKLAVISESRLDEFMQAELSIFVSRLASWQGHPPRVPVTTRKS